jgi:hypothetical protein
MIAQTAGIPSGVAMAISDREIALATRDDVTGIVALQDANLREVGGAMSVRFSRDFFDTAVSDLPIIVARNSGKVVGCVVATALTAQAHDPIIEAMLRAYPAQPNPTITVQSVSPNAIAAEA